MGAKDFPCLARFFESTPGQQAELLFPTLERLLKSKKLRRSDLALIAVDHGPGSFTGARVGVASARALAQALEIPVLGVDSLSALARQAAEAAEPGATVAAKVGAVSNESYFGVFKAEARGGWRTVRSPAWMTDTAVARHLSALAKKKGHLAYVARAADTGPFPAGLTTHALPAPDPSVVARLAFEKTGARPTARAYPFEKVVPVYLLPSWAERSQKPARRRP